MPFGSLTGDEGRIVLGAKAPQVAANPGGFESREYMVLQHPKVGASCLGMKHHEDIRHGARWGRRNRLVHAGS
jgi:hypothetical protein